MNAVIADEKNNELFEMYVSCEPTKLHSSVGASVAVGRCSSSSHIACCCCSSLTDPEPQQPN